MDKKAELRKFLMQDKGWRINWQWNAQPSHGSRQARVERASCRQALYRVFSRDYFDQKYPFKAYIPIGHQNVPKIRGFTQAIDLEARVYYSAHRLLHV